MASIDKNTLPGKNVELIYGEHRLELYVDMGVGIGGDKWPAADMFNKLITHGDWIEFFSKLLKRKRVIELGSGTGATGILVSRAFEAYQVIISDQRSHLDHIQANVDRNVLSNKNRNVQDGVDCDSSYAVNYANSCKVIEVDWFSPPVELRGSFDILLAMECVYKEELYRPLIETIKHLGTETAVTFLGSTREFTKPKFFALLQNYGFLYKKVPAAVIPPELGIDSNEIGLFLIYSSSCPFVEIRI